LKVSPVFLEDVIIQMGFGGSRLAGHFLVLEQRAPTLIHRSQRCQIRRADAELLTQMPPQCRWHNAHRFEKATVHAQKTYLQSKGELERSTAPIFDNAPFSVDEVEERLDLKGAQIPRQSAPPQTRRMPVLRVPTLRESAHNTPVWMSLDNVHDVIK
jgi:hypothetical protein